MSETLFILNIIAKYIHVFDKFSLRTFLQGIGNTSEILRRKNL